MGRLRTAPQLEDAPAYLKGSRLAQFKDSESTYVTYLVRGGRYYPFSYAYNRNMWKNHARFCAETFKGFCAENFADFTYEDITEFLGKEFIRTWIV